RVAGLGLVATSASPVSGSGFPGARVVARSMQPVLSRGAWLTRRLPGPSLPASDVAYVLSRLNFGADPDPAEVALTQQVVGDVRAATTGELLLEILRFDDTAALRDVHLPATVVVGTRDVATPVRHGQALAESIGGAQLLVLEGCGHMVMLERPHELDTALLALAERAAATPPGGAPGGAPEVRTAPAP
ncbi:MAG TPA: alpha/beta hydrolase, partial [Acidimicrobiales bacterium]|nr:alpha/beta hydrolase [Acidimicrobiales bacterium]